MRVALSSAAAPNDSLAALIEGCARRGLSALHLVAGHGHGLNPDASAAAVASAAALARTAGVDVVAYEINAANPAEYEAAVRISDGLGAVLVVRNASIRRVLAERVRAVVDTVVLDPLLGDVAQIAAIHFATHGTPPHVTLRGAGPEASQFEGRGIGALMARLALMNYRGVLALAPSSPAVLPVWATWLRRGRNWGCGSKAADPSLVQLD